ncbi:Patched domain-containing protein 3 [Gryllus bimaculatus]|nr:Patched domain-containing protein 3 [Gryllus bimaculatus]
MGCGLTWVDSMLNRGFYQLGLLVGRHPGYFLVIPVLLAGLCATGYQRIQYQIDPEYLFSPVAGEGKAERAIVEKYFKPNYTSRFNVGRITRPGRFGRVIVIPKHGHDMLRREIWAELRLLDQIIQNATVAWEDEETFTYRDVCARWIDQCFHNDILNLEGAAWEERFLEVVGEADRHLFKHISIARFASRTLDIELERNTRTVIPYFSTTFIIMGIFSITSCMMADWVRAKPWLGLLGNISAAMGTAAAFGVTMYMGVEFIGINLAAPFLMLGKKSWLYRIFCSGGVDPADPDNPVDNREHGIMVFFRDRVASLLNKWQVKALVLLVFAAYLTGACYGITKMKEGLERRKLSRADSYSVEFYDREDYYFREFPYRIQVVITGDLNYSDPIVQDQIENLTQTFENTTYISSPLYTESWLRSFVGYVKRNQDYLNLWLFKPNPFSLDVKFNEDGTRIIASRFLIQAVNITDSNDEKAMFELVRPTSIQSMIIGALIMMLVCFIFIPNAFCSLWVAFSIISIEAGVAGYMALWDHIYAMPTCPPKPNILMKEFENVFMHLVFQSSKVLLAQFWLCLHLCLQKVTYS